MTQLKTDSLMFYHIYADLVMLSKSNDLEKSAFDMNQHYLELKLFLEEIEHNPLLVMDECYRVLHLRRDCIVVKKLLIIA